MNALTQEMKRSLRELDLGLKGELTITSDMEDLSNSLFFDQVIQICYQEIPLNCPAQINHCLPSINGASLMFKNPFGIWQVPPSWAKLAYASLNGLSAW